MKKLLTLLVAAIMAVACCFGLIACGDNGGNGNEEKAGVNKEDIKVGFIFLHDDSSSYDKNFIDAAKDVATELGLKDEQVIIKTGIPEGEECTAAAKELVNEGCNIVFADSFGHEAYLIPVARDNADVQFCHATGTMAHTEGLANLHNAFASIYEGRFLAGIAAGLKLYELNSEKAESEQNWKIGYVGAFTFAEVMSGYTSYFLGVQYALNQKEAGLGDKLNMEVTFTGSWYDLDGEKAAAERLIANGCAIISGHADSDGVPNACEENNIPNVFYNGTHNKSVYLAACRINWRPYFKYIINQVIAGEKIATDWTGTIATGSVEVLSIGDIAAEGTQEMINSVKAKLSDGSLKVFDVDTFMVGGAKLTSFMADVDSDAAYTPDTEIIKTAGSITYVAESEFRSAPYFNGEIDRITLLDRNYG